MGGNGCDGNATKCRGHEVCKQIWSDSYSADMKCVGGQLFRWVGSDGRGGDRSRAHTGLLVPAQARAGSASRKQNPALPATSPRASGVEPQPSSNGPTGHDRSTAGADVRELMSNRKKSSKSTPGQMRSAECAGAGKPGQQPDETGELNMARWAFSSDIPASAVISSRS